MKAKAPVGYVGLLLHAHLPYIRHPEYEHFLEEHWLFEAITETYLPLLDVFGGLLNDGIPFRCAVSLSPTLVGMFQDPLLMSRYRRYLAERIELAEREVRRTRADPAFRVPARMYRKLYRERLARFEDVYGGDLVGAFRALRDAGGLELLTCAATHGFLPLLNAEPAAVRTQVRLGVLAHRRAFGRAPRGIWLPECGYDKGLEEVVKEAGPRYFCLETHGLLGGRPPPPHGVSEPTACPNGVAVFARDPESSRQVWSATEGYPGDFDYREFHRDIGYERKEAELRPCLLDGHIRIPTGLKYYRVTGTHGDKAPYDPAAARRKAALHAEHFLSLKERQIERLASGRSRPPFLLAPFDAELFGHWWFEGPVWLDRLFRLNARRSRPAVRWATPADDLRRYRKRPVVEPAPSTWGYMGHNAFWLNETNDFIPPRLLDMARRMKALARRFPRPSPLQRRALNQALRNLLLAQASDWAFLMKAGGGDAYARKRWHDHAARFDWLCKALQSGRIDPVKLEALEILDNPFPKLDYRVYV